jgi:hypothetical protein
LPNKGNLLDEANGLHPRTTNPTEEARPLREGLGRRLNPSFSSLFFLF